MAGHKKSVDQLDEALIALDAKLDEYGVADPIQIRAIGGYALMKHNIRAEDRAFTVDIDTVTRDYQQAVIQAIQDVARERDLDPDWLNNYNVADDDPSTVTDLIGEDWVDQDTSHLPRVQMAIASVPMLTRAKIMAAADGAISGRTQDKPDLLALIEHQGISTLDEFDRAYPDEFGQYEEARAFLGEQMTGKTPAPLNDRFARFPELRDLDLDSDIDLQFDDEDDYGFSL